MLCSSRTGLSTRGLENMIRIYRQRIDVAVDDDIYRKCINEDSRSTRYLYSDPGCLFLLKYKVPN